eukprot:59750-Prorocentrum_minimum.AAC.2
MLCVRASSGYKVHAPTTTKYGGQAMRHGDARTFLTTFLTTRRGRRSLADRARFLRSSPAVPRRAPEGVGQNPLALPC